MAEENITKKERLHPDIDATEMTYCIVPTQKIIRQTPKLMVKRLLSQENL